MIGWRVRACTRRAIPPPAKLREAEKTNPLNHTPLSVRRNNKAASTSLLEFGLDGVHRTPTVDAALSRDCWSPHMCRPFPFLLARGPTLLSFRKSVSAYRLGIIPRGSVHWVGGSGDYDSERTFFSFFLWLFLVAAEDSREPAASRTSRS
jgi:hypothetical protein